MTRRIREKGKNPNIILDDWIIRDDMENEFFPEIKNKLGLGCMRLPLTGSDADVDMELCCEMVDRFMEAGFNYFDTARVYHGGSSEKMIKACISDRYDRSEFVLTDKLSDGLFKKREDIRPLFEKQLETCGVDYFDFYLMHALRREVYPGYVETGAFEIAKELKEEGKIRHIGISFHDDSKLLEEILTDHPEIEVVQIQFNYLDFDDTAIESRELYELCEKFGVPAIVMEPVRGGGLVKLPEEAEKVFEELRNSRLPKGESEDDAAEAIFDIEKNDTNAALALRFAASFPQIGMVISGMGDMDMIEQNVRTFTDFDPIDEEELEAIYKVKEILKKHKSIGCTECHYCTSGCPKGIRIPDLFADYNSKMRFKSFNSDFYYSIHTENAGKASDCIECGQCEKECPQRLPIRDLLKKVAEVFE